MTTAKELLEQATPLPWKVRMSIHGDGYRHVQLGKDESYTTLDLEPTDARLIVYAVNRLSDYETAVDALVRMVATAEMFTDLNVNDDALVEARSALARLRGEK